MVRPVLIGLLGRHDVGGLITLSSTWLRTTTCVASALLAASVVVMIVGLAACRGHRGCATLGLVAYMLGAAVLAATGGVVLLATYLLRGALWP